MLFYCYPPFEHILYIGNAFTPEVIKNVPTLCLTVTVRERYVGPNMTWTKYKYEYN